MKAFKNLSEDDDRQLLLTTPAPRLAGTLNTFYLRFIGKTDELTLIKQAEIFNGEDDLSKEIATTLGI